MDAEYFHGTLSYGSLGPWMSHHIGRREISRCYEHVSRVSSCLLSFWTWPYIQVLHSQYLCLYGNVWYGWKDWSFWTAWKGHIFCSLQHPPAHFLVIFFFCCCLRCLCYHSLHCRCHCCWYLFCCYRCLRCCCLSGDDPLTESPRVV